MFLRALFILAIIFTYVGELHAADPIRCNCLFVQSSGYVGVGTRAACSTYTEKNKGPGESCQISFGGTGYQEPQLSRLGLDPKQYREKVFAITMFNLAMVRNGTPQNLSTVEFIRDAIPIYMRATYLRAETRLDQSTLNELDGEVTAATNEYAGQIADVFLGKTAPFETKWRDRHNLAVQRGAIRFIYAERISLAAVFFDPEQ
jgi:hypothetical protein